MGELESSPERVEISYEGESALAQCLPVWGQVSAVMQKGAELVVSEKTNPTPPLRGKAVEGISEAVEPVRFSAELDAIQRESRERLATKVDDADVPIYLWEDHLINDNDGWLVPEDLRESQHRAFACAWNCNLEQYCLHFHAFQLFKQPR